MKSISVRTVLTGAVIVLLAGCAGKPSSPPLAMSDSDPHSKDANRIVCKELPPPTGSHIPQGAKVCHTYAEWQLIEKRSQEAVYHGQRMPGQGATGSGH